MSIDRNEARERWAKAQWLDERRSESLAQTCASTGWIRTLGGAAAYLALAARTEGVSAAEVHRSLESGELRVVPAVRGCIYLVPREHVGIALRLAESLSAKRNARDLEKVGVVDAELRDVGEAVLATLQDGPVTTHGLRRAIPDGVVRSLGDVGKKVGLSSTLPSALRMLEFEGRIARHPQDSRLDHERYEWSIAAENPFEGVPVDDAELHRRLAELFFTWAGPATRKEFASWTGLNQTQAKRAIASAQLREVEVERLGSAFVPAEAGPTASTDRVALLGALDNLYATRLSAELLVDAPYADILVGSFGRGPVVRLADAVQPLERMIVVGARTVGSWAWNPAEGRSEAFVFDALDAPQRGLLSEEIERADVLLRELGHGRCFSLDSEDKLAERFDRIRTRQTS